MVRTEPFRCPNCGTFYQLVKADAGPETVDRQIKRRAYPNDWKDHPSGQSYLQGLRSLRPDVQRKAAEVLATLGPAISRVEEAFATKLGRTADAKSRLWEPTPPTKSTKQTITKRRLTSRLACLVCGIKAIR